MNFCMELLHWNIIVESTFVPVHSMEVYGTMKIQLLSFLTSALDWGERSASCPGWFTPQEGAPIPNEYNVQ
jgi:hypothetical protein